MLDWAHSFRVLACCALLLALARPASADWQVAPFFGWSFASNTTIVDAENATTNTHRAFGVAVSYVTRGPLGIEGYAAYIPGFFNDPKLHGPQNVVDASRVYAVMGNIVLTSPSRWNEYGLRPFISGGLGLLRAEKTDVVDALPVHKTLLGINIGGGAVGFITDKTGLRFDLRFVRNLHDREDFNGVIGGRVHLRYWMASVGLVLR